MYPFFHNFSRWMAYLGGAVLTALILLTCASIFGRSVSTFFHSDGVVEAVPALSEWVLALGVGTIQGDVELLEAGMAFAIFAFIPYCQITGGHAVVDMFTTKMSFRANQIIRCFAETLFAIVLVIIAVQLGQGTWSKFNSNGTTLVLGWPVWYGFALSLVGAVAAAIVAVYVATTRIYELTSGRSILPLEEGADH